MKRIALFVAIAILAVAAGVYFGVLRHTPGTPQDQALAHLLSQDMPQAGPGAKTAPQALAQWRGKPLIINFWATWCAPCVEEMPALNALSKEIAPIQIIGIGVDSSKNIDEFAEKFHILYPLYLAGTGATEALQQLGNASGGLPFTLLVGADGTIKKSYLGSIKFDELHKDLKLLQAP
ncbi:TlpA disulfide reductase family protein [Herbaspirillum sp. RTI4]|uniref:TlpA family protein disulfide reductase n=1 Tax=Herbaspirillum sp. RTI4 TaxID=3048640 RepID=UPI002AB50DDD|nr:TlpA disulfide reductase family protein [Herbaspirillum sp. RTI4]MDY7577530.1 TlpA disulfide reductase family protein [Herbaspirillum sp. RTI4]MEA9981005.1 TlpA disulfide reductase family protein [Herbaspirillum sp. RTI4]